MSRPLSPYPYRHLNGAWIITKWLLIRRSIALDFLFWDHFGNMCRFDALIVINAKALENLSFPLYSSVIETLENFVWWKQDSNNHSLRSVWGTLKVIFYIVIPYKIVRLSISRRCKVACFMKVWPNVAAVFKRSFFTNERWLRVTLRPCHQTWFSSKVISSILERLSHNVGKL